MAVIPYQAAKLKKDIPLTELLRKYFSKHTLVQ